jgi:peptidoglycan/LPS O-acetylase OafA/YrhL
MLAGVVAGVLPGRSPLFLLGIMAFQRISGKAGAVSSSAALVAIGIAAVVVMVRFEGWLTALTGTAAAVAMVLGHRVKVQGWAGRYLAGVAAISYSLYLIHVPVGGRVINLGSRFIHGTLGHGALSLAALCSCLIFAWLFHISVEWPSIELSRFARRRRTSEGVRAEIAEESASAGRGS